MEHLTREALARLLEESPTYEERTHLEGCLHCRRELQMLREQTAALVALPVRSLPRGAWDGLEVRLSREGLLQPVAPPLGRRILARLGALPKTAAAVAIFLLGSAAGAAWTSNAGPGQQAVLGAPPAATADPEDAARALNEAEALYLAALSRYAETSELGESDDPVARLAAIEAIVLTTGAALEDAPADPIINGYHLSALTQREATLRQIAQNVHDPWF